MFNLFKHWFLVVLTIIWNECYNKQKILKDFYHKYYIQMIIKMVPMLFLSSYVVLKCCSSWGEYLTDNEVF